MKQHRGEIVRNAIKKSDFPIKRFAKALGMSRNTRYNRFSTAKLNDKFIAEVGRIIYYDFSVDIPDFGSTAVNHMLDGEDQSFYTNTNFNLLRQLEIKYISLLENYNELLKILVGLANTNDYKVLR